MGTTITDTAAQISVVITPMADNMVWGPFALAMDDDTIAVAAEATHQVVLTATQIESIETPNGYGLPDTVTRTSVGSAITIPAVSREVVWASSNNAVATVSDSGLVTGVANGTATLTATFRGKVAVGAITVS